MDILRTEQLKKYFRIKGKVIRAVDGVDISVRGNRTTALVGESGCGKSTLARTILGLYTVDEGRVVFRDRDITDARSNRKFITENIQVVFQNPFLSFDPRYTVFATLYEVLTIRSRVKRESAYKEIAGVLKQVGLEEGILYRYPHQLSGGQLQRVSIARAVLCRPQVIILDEPTSNLDVSTTVRIIELFSGLQGTLSLTYLFISHNLKLVRNISHNVFVMYRGKIVESGPKEAVYNNPLHPYTHLLMEAADYRLRGSYRGKDVEGGCVFISRCPRRGRKCSRPPEKVCAGEDHYVYCNYV